MRSFFCLVRLTTDVTNRLYILSRNTIKLWEALPTEYGAVFLAVCVGLFVCNTILVPWDVLSKQNNSLIQSNSRPCFFKPLLAEGKRNPSLRNPTHCGARITWTISWNSIQSTDLRTFALFHEVLSWIALHLSAWYGDYECIAIESFIYVSTWALAFHDFRVGTLRVSTLNVCQAAWNFFER